jgi:hypothetical protein
MRKQGEELEAGSPTAPTILKFHEGDPEDPINWRGLKKKAVVANLCLLSFIS